MKIIKEVYTIPDNVVMFYDRHLRLWTLYIKDEEGNQISNTEYTPSKADAIEMAQDIDNFVIRESLKENNMKILKELNEWFQVSPYEDGNRILRDAVSKVFSSDNKSRLIKVATDVEPNYPYSFATTTWARQGNDYTHASIQMKVGYSELCSFYIGWEDEEIISRTNISTSNNKLHSVAHEVIKEFNNIFTQEEANFEKVTFLESTWSPVEYDEETGEYYSRPGNEFDGIDPQIQNNDEELNEGLQYIESINSRKGIRQLKESTDKFSIFIDTDQEPDRDILLDANSLEDAKQKANELSKKHGGYKVIVNDSNHKQIYCARRGRACESLTETYHIDDEEVMNKVTELGKELESQGFKYVNSKDSRDYYDFYRKIEDGKGVWKAVIYNYGAAEIIDVTYEQARGIEPIDSLEQLRKDLGKMLLPNHSINESNVKNIYYHDDLDGIKRGQWLNVKEQDGRTYAKWNFEPDEEDKWFDVTDSIKELPYHNFAGERPAKMFSFGGWRYWMDDEVDKFYEIEKNRIDPDFKIGESLKESFDYNEVQSGDLVNFGKYGNLYVCNAEYLDNAFWVTDEESDRYNRKASGWTIDKELAEYIVDEDDDLNEALGRDYSHIPEVKSINYSNNKNGNLLPYLDSNAFKAALEETGLEAFKIKPVRLKSVSLGDLKDEFGGRAMSPWKWTRDFDSSIPIGDGNEFDIFWKGSFPNKVTEKLQTEKENTSEEKEDAKLNESEDGWVKRFNSTDKYYKGPYIISAIPSYPDSTKTSQWHVEKVKNGKTIEHLGNYSSLEKAKEVVDALPSKNISEDIEVPTLEGPNEGAEYGLSELINAAIQHELETVNEYNVLALNARAEGYDDIASVIDEINTEENKHIGQLQELLKTISPNAQAIVAGETEASDDLVSIEESFDKIPVITFKGKRTFDTEEEAWEFKKSLGDKYRAIHKVEYPDMTFYIVDFEEN